MSEQTAEPRIPQQWDHTVAFYEALAQKSTTVPIDGVDVLRYEGQVSVLFKQVCPHGNYSKVSKNLRVFRCIVSDGRGGGKDGASLWYLVKHPNEALADPTANRVATYLLNQSSQEGESRALQRQIDDIVHNIRIIMHRLTVLEGNVVQLPTDPVIVHDRSRAREQLQSLVDFADRLEEDG